MEYLIGVLSVLIPILAFIGFLVWDKISWDRYHKQRLKELGLDKWLKEDD